MVNYNNLYSLNLNVILKYNGNHTGPLRKSRLEKIQGVACVLSMSLIAGEHVDFSMDRYMELPSNTLIYCGHEYTESNLEFAMTVEPHNEEIIKALKEVQKSRSINKPSFLSQQAL